MFSKSDYYAFHRIVHSPDALHAAGPWDFFLSAFDETDRVQIPFGEVSATEKQLGCTSGVRTPKERLARKGP